MRYEWSDRQLKLRAIINKVALVLSLLLPASAWAQGTVNITPTNHPIDFKLVIAGALLIATTGAIAALLLRIKRSSTTLTVLANELESTRHRLSDTTQSLEEAEFIRKGTEDRYQHILYEAEVGMFQIEIDGTCSYINSSLEKLSGLYQKKATKEGIISAIHPDDRDRFRLEWQDFTEKDSSEFFATFRFRNTNVRGNGREVKVSCRANKVRNEKKEVESYIGWIWDITTFQEECNEYEFEKEQYKYFIDETIEGFYRLVPEKPISTKLKPDKMTDAILSQMKLVSCNETFASLYGARPKVLEGQQINSLAGGCGLFKNAEMVKSFVENGFKAVGVESIRQDPRGNRLNLTNNVVGQIKDDHLVAIWGSQRNISKQKRELASLSSQTNFMHRILNAMPADIHVKDTRCRYLYVNGKMAERTGIPEEEWVGKTIFEVLPAAPLDYDHGSIQAMKSSKENRSEKEYEIRGKKIWMDSIQIPLVSDDGLVEGVVGFSIDSTARKQKDEKLANRCELTEKRLALRDEELKKEKGEHGKTSLTLQDVNRKLRVQEAEVDGKIREYEDKLKARQADEEALVKNRDELLKRQKELEEQLAKRLEEVNKEAEKRREQEDIVKLKETEIAQAEERANQRIANVQLETKQTEEQTNNRVSKLQNEMEQIKKQVIQRETELQKEATRREEITKELSTSKDELDTIRQEMITLIEQRDIKFATLEEHQKKALTTATEQQQQEMEAVRSERKTALNQLKKTEAVLEKTQTKLKEITEKYEADLKKEHEAKTAAEKQLNATTAELGELQQQFSIRIEQETSVLKQELGNRQIREKTLRQNEKELSHKINDLEEDLRRQKKIQKEQSEVGQAAEEELNALRHQIENVEEHQKERIEQETAELNNVINKTKEEENHLHEQLKKLQQTQQVLEDKISKQSSQLEIATADRKKLQSVLTDTQNKLSKTRSEQNGLVSHETTVLEKKIEQHHEDESKIRDHEQELIKQNAALQQIIEQRTKELEEEITTRTKLSGELKHLRITYDINRKSTTELIKDSKKELRGKIEQHKAYEKELSEAVTDIKDYAKGLQKDLEKSAKKLADEIKKRTELEREQSQLKKEPSTNNTSSKADGTLTQSNDKERQKETEDLRTQLDQLSLEIAVRNQQLADESSKRQQLEREFNKLEEKHAGSLDADLKKRICDLEKKNNTHKQKLAKTDEARKKAEDQLKQVQNCNKRNSLFVDNLDDTIRTALSPALNSSKIIQHDTNLSEEQRKKMSTIETNSHFLINMMNYRRELNHIADGSNPVIIEQLNLHELIKQIDQQFGKQAEIKNIFFALSYAQQQSINSVPERVETDDRLVQQVLNTLLKYAIEHTNKGRLGLHAYREDLTDDQITIAFELAFTAGNEKDEQLDAIFGNDEFNEDQFQLGIDFSLALCRRYAQLLGGDIKLEYRSNRITSLTFNFICKNLVPENVSLMEEANNIITNQ